MCSILLTNFGMNSPVVGTDIVGSPFAITRFNAKRASLVQSRIKALDRMALVDDVVEDPTFRLVFPMVPMLQHHIIQLDDITFGYSPDKVLLKNVNVRLDQSSRVALGTLK